MAFNNQLREYQMPGAFPETDRDEFGYTPGDYVQMMHEIDSKFHRLPGFGDSRLTMHRYHS